MMTPVLTVCPGEWVDEVVLFVAGPVYKSEIPHQVGSYYLSNGGACNRLRQPLCICSRIVADNGSERRGDRSFQRAAGGST
jgi:hypothetical protein